ncbi:hypothetical protein V6Z11_A02G187400 [Gossypium hirsutum]
MGLNKRNHRTDVLKVFNCMTTLIKKQSKTDAEKRLSLPTEYMKHLPRNRRGHPVNLAVIDMQGRHYPKPVLSAGWLDFVKVKCLRPGDHIMFKVEPNAFYTIGVKRRIRLLGAEVWTAVF